MQRTLIIIGGPTAVGKSSLSMGLAKTLNCEIISADSRQVYREMSIGTAKPTEADLNTINHHCINIASIQEVYSAGKYEQDADAAVEAAFNRSNYAIMCGGTGLYIQAFLNGLDKFPEITDEAKAIVAELTLDKTLASMTEQLKEVDPNYYESVDLSNRRRISRALEVYYSSGKPYSHLLAQRTQKPHNYNIVQLWLNTDRDALYHKINARTLEMIASGWIEEVESLLPYRNLRSMDTVGYKELFAYLDGSLSKEAAIAEIQKQTRRYAKRQVTWFSNQYKGKLLQYEGKSSQLIDQVLSMVS